MPFSTPRPGPQIVEIALDAISANPEQPRQLVDAAALDELAASIARHGLLQPVLVQPAGDGVILVAGQRRLEALRQLGRTTAPAIVIDGDPGEIALVENLQRQDLDPFEEAAAVARLIERHGYSQTEVGAVLGKRQSAVSDLLAVNRLPQRIRDEYRHGGKIARALLIELARVSDARQQQGLWDLVKGGGMNVRDLRFERRFARDLALAGMPAGDEPARAPVVQSGQPARRLLRAAERLLSDLQGLSAPLPAEGSLITRLHSLHQVLGAVLGAETEFHQLSDVR